MSNFSYTKSPNLIKKVQTAENLHSQLVLMAIPINIEHELMWKSTLEKIYFGLHFSEAHVPEKDTVEKLLSPIGKKNLTELEEKITVYKKTLDELYYEYFAKKRRINELDIVAIAELLKGVKNNGDRNGNRGGHIEIETTELNNLRHGLDYIQTNPDHPLIQAALSQLLISQTSAFKGIEYQLSFLTAYLFMFTHGFAGRRMIALETSYFRHKNTYHQYIIQALRDDNVTDWINFFLDITISALEKKLDEISRINVSEDTDINLSDRQKMILSFLDKSQSTISNKQVQKSCKISAITAARDLAKLTQNGYIYPVGKGRSTLYRKA